MNRWFALFFLIAIFLVGAPFRSPAPLIYQPGEGWTYEPVGGEGKWKLTRAKDQVEAAEAAFNGNDYGLALKCARRVIQMWPMSDYAPRAQYLIGRCYEAQRKDEQAFRAYQQAIEKYPKLQNYDEIVQRQFEIANRFLAGQWFKLWGVIPFFPSMARTAELYEKIIADGPFSDVAPHAQLNIGTAWEKDKSYPEAVRAFELAADRYNHFPEIASDALYRAGMAYYRQSKTAEYDQSIPDKAISTFTDFMTLYPRDARVAEARKIIEELKREKARGSFEIARYYEKNRHWSAALIYYNEVLLQDAQSPYAEAARQRMDALKRQ